MFNIVLFQPEIPPNTGNIIRLCANTGCALHLIHPLGFKLNDTTMKRAGLDYHEKAVLHEHQSFDDFIKNIRPKRLFAIETCGIKNYDEVNFIPGDTFIFGQETKGLPPWLLARLPKENILKIPMKPNIRSINLSNAVALITYEAWRQNQFSSFG
ncbi:MAG: tRNA (uridine(34)/cytosine(34)/5-carboxymethylaminomethyluridine(34)-2'-O)-methyltransferase TrmL [Pseudomonadota bacterium]